MRLISIALVCGLAGCAPLAPMSYEQRAYIDQMQLEQQRAYNQQQLEAQKAMLNRRPAYLQPQTPVAQPAGVSAFWTGRSQAAQSVTGASGFNCEYSYAGKTFWRMFSGFCPSSVQVQ